jgi:DNA primase
MMAGIQDPHGEFAGISLTWLCADGSGKAPVDPPRKIYGPYGGGCIRLAPAAEQLVLCEGIESGLSILQACTLPVWAGLSASNLPHVELPAIVREVIVAADADEAGEAAAQAAARRFLREGREIVRIARTGRQGADFNDLISR